jgi:hypothetical protein
MKKIILSISLIVFTFCYVNAQTFSLTWEDEAIGDTVVLHPESPETTVIVFEVILNNLSDHGINVKVARNEIYLVENTVNYFCWGVCYTPVVDTSGQYMFINKDSSSVAGDYSAHYEIHETIGVSIIEYTFYNMDNPSENIKVVLKFDTSPDGIDENILKNTWVSDIYPNPASNQINIDYSMPIDVNEASVKIVNLLGTVVKEDPIDTRASNMKMDIFDLKGGIYFYSIYINGEIYNTKKLIIR